MKVLMMDIADDLGLLMGLALQAQDAGHAVRYWHADEGKVGEGLVETVTDWERWTKWADLTVLSGNAKYPKGFEKKFTEGIPIFGANPAAAQLELDRAKGQEVLEKYGIETLPYEVVESIDDAAKYLLKEKRPVVIKPWGGESDKAMTYVCNTVDDGLYMLERWKKLGLKGKLMLQEKVDGVEVGISGFFGPAGWCGAIEESFEHKKFLTGNLGQNTGEMGTVIRHVTKSKLFDELLEPLTDQLHLLRYVGDCSINCIVAEDGTPYPLEFTMRLGWPDFNIRQSLFRGDPVKWMAELVHGRDTLRVSRDTAVGVVMVHGDFPHEHEEPEFWAGFPIRAPEATGISFQQVRLGEYPEGNKTKRGIVTAGSYVAVVHGTGGRVRTAARHAYELVGEVKWPSNVGYRIDIGERLEEDLPKLHKHGYAVGLEY